MNKNLLTGALLGVLILPFVHAAENATPMKATDSFWEVISTRRSVRKFKPDAVPEKDLVKMVDAARMAPNAGNEQAWKFVIVQDKKVIEKLKDGCVEKVTLRIKEHTGLSGDSLKKEVQKQVDQWITDRLGAPAYIAVLADRERKWPSYNRHDGPLAAGYLLLAARALGYGSCYFTDSISEDVVRKALNVPDRYEVVCITPVGIPAESPEKEKKPLEEFIVKDTF